MQASRYIDTTEIWGDDVYCRAEKKKSINRRRPPKLPVA
jgi:hypothetical protein